MGYKECECFECDGEGEYEQEVDCDCPGCFNGEHAESFDCGQEVDGVPCEKCDGKGWIEKTMKCETCDGTGLNHNWEESGIQMTADMKEKRKVYKCKDCGKTKINIEQATHKS